MDTRIEIINNWRLNDIFKKLEEGSMKIPRFQRAYVWERSKIVMLLNSIYHEYPIGTFFLWETSADMQNFCRDITEFGFPNKPDSSKFSFILDGQQRITSLYVALNGKTLNKTDYSTICFNIEKKEFKVPTLKTEQNNIPVWQIYNDREFSKLMMKYSQEGKMDFAQTVMECHNILWQYPISINISKNMELDEVVTIFERINMGGKRLTLFDLVHASVWSSDFDLREKIKEFNYEPAIRAFGEISAEIFTQSLALNLKEDCTNKHQLKLDNAECKSVWDNTIECIRLAIDYIKGFGVQRLEIIPYQSIISMIQFYFYKSGEKYISQELSAYIEEWFWTVTFSQRYSSSTLTKMNEDAEWLKELAEGNYYSRRFTVKLNVENLKKVRMNTRSVIKNGVLCLMALNRPVDFDNGQLVTLDKTNASRQNSKENHHFFPYSLYRKLSLQENDINSLLNFAFITKRLNLAILNDYPSVYLTNYNNTCAELANNLRTHFITEEALDSAMSDDYESFVRLRGECILKVINKVCKTHLADSMVNTDDSEEVLDTLLDDIDSEEVQ